MQQFARGRRALTEADANLQEEARRRAHYLNVASAVSAQQQQQHRLPAQQAAAPPPAPLPPMDRKQAYLQGRGASLEAQLDQVGQGGFAVVRRSADGGSVIKTYSTAEDDPVVQQHLQNEMALAGRLRHPNIIGPGRVTRPSSERVEISMEYASGGSLADYVKRAKYASSSGGSALPENEACALFQGVVDAIAYLHANELEHGDIKLGNVLLDGRHVARLIDFGTCRAASRPVGAALSGTLACMAPETLDGRPQYHGLPADVWSLGVLLYNLLSRGEYPFVGRDEEHLRENICTARLRLPEALSAPCQDLLDGMLAKDPKARLKIDDVARHPWVRSVRGVQSRDPMVACDLSAHMRFLQVSKA